MSVTTHERIVRSVALVGVFLVVGKALGAGREVLLAARYGTTEVMDAYLFLWNLANWPISVWLSTLTVVAVPIFIQSANGPAESRQFLRELTALAAVIGVAIAAVMIAVMYVLLRGIPAFVTHNADGLESMIWPMSLMLPTGMLVGVFSARCISLERHINTLAEGVPALCVIVIVFSSSDHTGTALVWGTVIGYAVHAATLALVLPHSDGIALARLNGLRSPLWPTFWVGFWSIAIGQVVLGGTTVIDQLLVNTLGPGAISELGYANRVLALILGVGTTAVARATLPVLSAHPAEAARTAWIWARVLFAIGTLSIPLLWVVSPWTIETIFQRGAFGSEQTTAVAQVLRAGLLQMPFYFVSLVAVQVLAARGQHHRILQIAVINVAVKLVGNVVFIGIYGVAGVMIGTALMYASATVLAWYFVVRRERE